MAKPPPRAHGNPLVRTPAAGMLRCAHGSGQPPVPHARTSTLSGRCPAVSVYAPRLGPATHRARVHGPRGRRPLRPRMRGGSLSPAVFAHNARIHGLRSRRQAGRGLGRALRASVPRSGRIAGHVRPTAYSLHHLGVRAVRLALTAARTTHAVSRGARIIRVARTRRRLCQPGGGPPRTQGPRQPQRRASLTQGSHPSLEIQDPSLRSPPPPQRNARPTKRQPASRSRSRHYGTRSVHYGDRADPSGSQAPLRARTPHQRSSNRHSGTRHRPSGTPVPLRR